MLAASLAARRIEKSSAGHILRNLEDVLQTELNQARVNRRAGDVTESTAGHTQRAGVAELCVIEGIEEFGTEN